MNLKNLGVSKMETTTLKSTNGGLIYPFFLEDMVKYTAEAIQDFQESYEEGKEDALR